MADVEVEDTVLRSRPVTAEHNYVRAAYLYSKASCARRLPHADGMSVGAKHGVLGVQVAADMRSAGDMSDPAHTHLCHNFLCGRQGWRQRTVCQHC